MSFLAKRFISSADIWTKSTHWTFTNHQPRVRKKQQQFLEMVVLLALLSFLTLQLAAEEPKTTDCLLASSSKDKTIRIWNCNVGRISKVINLPKPPGHMTEQQRGRTWLTLSWAKAIPLHLISSSHGFRLFFSFLPLSFID